MRLRIMQGTTSQQDALAAENAMRAQMGLKPREARDADPTVFTEAVQSGEIESGTILMTLGETDEAPIRHAPAQYDLVIDEGTVARAKEMRAKWLELNGRSS